MTLPIESALNVLSAGGRSRGADELVERRIGAVQTFLAEDLLAVERVLGDTSDQASRPAADAARHLVDQGGKRVRPMALLLAARCFCQEGSETFERIRRPLIEMAAVVELVHSATLLHDDVVDEGMERRGSITARRRYGNGISVLAGDFLLVQALERTGRHAPALLGDLIKTLGRLVDGEIVQLRGRSELDASEETYLRILSDKTASLFVFATRVGALLAGASTAHVDALASYGESLGVAFQLVDDVLDYSGGSTGKNLFADVVEGKMTLPLVLAMKDDAALRELVRELHQGRQENVPRIVERVLASGACDTVRKRAQSVTQSAERALEGLPQSPARTLLSVVASEMTRRMS